MALFFSGSKKWGELATLPTNENPIEVVELDEIHTYIQHKKTTVGSDIWRFFKNDVKDYCVASENHYRNILVILTDGYLFHEDSKQKIDNRYSYILPEMIQGNGLRKTNWKETFDKNDYGLIATRDDLQDLEVLVLEVNPSKGNVADEEVIKAILEKWFTEMKVKKFAIHNTDLPTHIENRIKKFLN